MDRSARSDRLFIEAPHAGERAALDALILRSKARWGYDAAMMDIMARWLRLDPAAMADDRVRVARTGTAAAGVAQLGPPDEAGCAALDALFIEPAFMGSGAGAMLYRWALGEAQARGALALTILSDPYARGFYEAMGARFTGDVPSAAIPGRILPRLVHVLADRKAAGR